jgi:uncharacterized protein (TIGR03905 family)
MLYEYATQGTCARSIIIEAEEGMIKRVQFAGGCPGNTQGVARLAENRNIDEVISLLDGIRCGYKSTSCPDQLAKALKKIKERT